MLILWSLRQNILRNLKYIRIYFFFAFFSLLKIPKKIFQYFLGFSKVRIRNLTINFVSSMTSSTTHGCGGQIQQTFQSFFFRRYFLTKQKRCEVTKSHKRIFAAISRRYSAETSLVFRCSRLFRQCWKVSMKNCRANNISWKSHISRARGTYTKPASELNSQLDQKKNVEIHRSFVCWKIMLHFLVAGRRSHC